MSRFMMNRGGGEIPVPGNDAYTKLLLHFDGNIIDSSAVGHAFSNSGTSFNTSRKMFGSGSLQGAGGNSYISTPMASDLAISSGIDFTIDFWMNLNGAIPAGNVSYQIGGINKGSTNQFTLSLSYASLQGAIGFSCGRADGTTNAGGYASSPSGSLLVTDSNWHHIACVRSGSNWYLFLDGVKYQSVSSYSGGLWVEQAPFTIGSTQLVTVVTPGSASSFPGLLDEFRYSVGIARWTGNFTPPTGPYI